MHKDLISPLPRLLHFASTSTKSSIVEGTRCVLYTSSSSKTYDDHYLGIAKVKQ